MECDIIKCFIFRSVWEFGRKNAAEFKVSYFDLCRNCGGWIAAEFNVSHFNPFDGWNAAEFDVLYCDPGIEGAEA